MYIDLQKPVEDALRHIHCIIDAEEEFQVGPLVLSRLPRGGKTTVLRRIFDALRDDPAGYYPIIISAAKCTFSGHDPFPALIRAIAFQLTDVTSVPSDDGFKCTDSCLVEQLDRIQNDTALRIVLCIDDLDALGELVHPRVATFLVNTFLDRKRRYLVFSTCVALQLSASSEYRKLYYLRMPFCTDQTKLRELPHASGVTPLQVTLNQGIPSLVYLDMNQWSLECSQQPSDRFIEIMDKKVKQSDLSEKEFLLKKRLPLLRGFLRTVLTGCIESGSYFRCFAERAVVAGKPALCFPILYVALILDFLGERGALSAYEKLSGAASIVGGQEWTRVVTFAAFVLGLVAKYIPDHGVEYIPTDGPFHIANGGAVTAVVLLDMPADFSTLNEARGGIVDQARQLTSGTLIIFRRAAARFPLFDTFLVYCGAEGMHIHGILCALQFEGPKAPEGPPPAEWVNRAWYLRARQPTAQTADTSSSTTTSSNTSGTSGAGCGNGAGITSASSKTWEFPSLQDLELSLLGFTFQGLRPDKWGEITTPVAFWESTYTYEAGVLG